MQTNHMANMFSGFHRISEMLINQSDVSSTGWRWTSAASNWANRNHANIVTGNATVTVTLGSAIVNGDALIAIERGVGRETKQLRGIETGRDIFTLILIFRTNVSWDSCRRFWAIANVTADWAHLIHFSLIISKSKIISQSFKKFHKLSNSLVLKNETFKFSKL
jgi:hypothetical protein